MNQKTTHFIPLYGKHQLKVGAVLFVSYLATSALTAYFLPASSFLEPASAIALCALYFGSVRLWPVVYVAAFTSSALHSNLAGSLILTSAVPTLQAIAGAYLLQKTHIDPLFRRYRDTFYFLLTMMGVSFITPTLKGVLTLFQNTFFTVDTWWHAYIATLSCLLISTPFILRWFTKLKFSRTILEIAETVAIFAILIGISISLFSHNIEFLFGIPLVYFLLIPLFWIALRLRPRFITLALMITSLFAISNALVGTDSGAIGEQLFDTEILFIALGISFSIITSLEEDRRVNTNLTLSQLGALTNAVARVSSESKAKNDFIAILGHELRNPLASILSYIELLQLKGSHDADDTKALEVMMDRMGVVRRLLDELLDMSRITEGKITIKKEAIDLDEVLTKAILSTEHHRKELHQQLVYTALSKSLYVSGDRLRLEQVFSNLLTNASKYSSSGDTIEIKVTKNNHEVRIEIIDTGVGLNADDLKVIFLPFQQIEQGERTKKGLGIGLALVRNFIEMHDGNIVAISPGRGLGSTFTVRLPALPPENYPPITNSNTPTLVRKIHEHGTNGPLVLIVDDSDKAAGALGRLLELEGCRVAYAYNGNQAIEKAERLSPHAILLDINLPDQDGYTVAKTLRAQGFTGRLIALTGDGSPTAKKLSKEAGCQFYLVKPVSLTELQSTLQELV